MEPYAWWLIIAVIAAIAEAISLGLVTVWFVAGALVAFGVAFAGGPLWLQLIVFLAVSLACLFALRPLALKHRKQGQRLEATPVGQPAVVTEAIPAGGQTGRVETPDHMSWAAP